MERNDVTTIKGREFVSIDEFVRRMDTTRQTLEKKSSQTSSSPNQYHHTSSTVIGKISEQ